MQTSDIVRVTRGSSALGLKIGDKLAITAVDDRGSAEFGLYCVRVRVTHMATSRPMTLWTSRKGAAAKTARMNDGQPSRFIEVAVE